MKNKENIFKSKYTREKITRIGFEIVAYAGEARGYLVEALHNAKNKDFNSIDELLKRSDECLNLAHKSQTEMLFLEANGEFSDITVIMVHGQDHLMTTMLLREILENLIDIYREKK